jgi:ectoine hydroxylase-related dioxygenase (phytanoyl-CoA dioxygenase family)
MAVGAIELHPWNRNFAWTDRTAPFRRLDADQVAAFDRDGFLVLPDVFGDDELDPLVEALDRNEAVTDEFLRSRADERIAIAESGAITFTVHLVEREPAAAAFVRSPVFADLCHDLVGPDVRLYWDQAVYKKPEKPRRFPWHQDNGYAFVEPQQYLTCWVALTDATVDNGCPQVIPGLHRAGTYLHRYVDPLGWEILASHPDAVAAPVGRGGIVVFSSLTPHLTGPNLTDAVRKAYIVQFAPDGAAVLAGDPAAGEPTGRVPADAPGRQFPILLGGRPVPPTPEDR